MSKILKWFENRWECIDNEVDIPILDSLICYAAVPILVFGLIALGITAPVWGIPYVIYRVYFAERREE